MLQIENGAWLNLINPDQQEILYISNNLNILVDHIKAELDKEERSRIEVDEGCTLVLINIPVPKSDQKDGGSYYTIPLGIICRCRFTFPHFGRINFPHLVPLQK